MKASGKFEVNLKPLEPYFKGTDGITIGRMSLEKTFSGELSAKSKGDMLSVATPVTGSAGYVAVEQVTGTLGDKKGSFALQHYGMMNEGDSSLTVEVIPGSGTNELEGISGNLTLNIKNGQHYYEFEYTLPE